MTSYRFTSSALAELNQATLRATPFGLIYQIRSDEILILSVMDLRRDPTSWKHFL